MLVLILDALSVETLHQLDMPWLQSKYNKSGGIFTCSTRPHTAESNPMIWGGVRNKTRYWVEPEHEDVQGLHGKTKSDDGFVDPAMFFDRSSGSPVDGAHGHSRASDYANSFIWDDLAASDIDARIIQVPITLPPFSTENVTDTLEDAWFPDTQSRQRAHIRDKPAIIAEQLTDGAEFIGSSIQMPDKWLHGIGEGEVTEEWVMSEAPVLDEQVKELITTASNAGHEWCIFGDHGSPIPGAMNVRDGEYTLPRHQKESVIISSAGINPPSYTHELYDWMKQYYNVSEASEQVLDAYRTTNSSSIEQANENAVDTRLENLGYK